MSKRIKHITTREIKSVEQRVKRMPICYSSAADYRSTNIDARRNRGVLTPIIRGCSEPKWLRD